MVSGNPVRPVGEEFPRLARVLGAVDVGPEVAEQETVARHVDLVRVVARDVDRVHAALGRHVGRRHVLPRLPAVERHVHRPVVRAGPDHVGVVRRCLDHVQRGVVFLARRVARDRPARHHLPVGAERGEVGRDLIPAAAAVRRAMHVLGAVEDQIRVVRRDLDGHDALEPVGQVGGVGSVDVHRADVVLLLLPRPLVIDAEASLAVGVDDVGVTRLGHGRSRLAPARRAPVGVRTARRRQRGLPAGHGDRIGVVLLARVEPVREAVVHIDLIEFGRRLIVDR